MSLSVDATAISLVAVIISALTFIISIFRIAAKQNERIAKLEECTRDLKDVRAQIDALQSDVRMLLTHDKTLWSYVEENFGKILHSPHTPEIDRLIEKMPRITIPEAERLKCMLLDQREQVDGDKKMKLVYNFYLARLDILISDQKEGIT